MAEAERSPRVWIPAAFQQLADNSRDGIWACDRELRCLYWNAAMEAITGFPAGRALGHGIVEVLSRVTDTDEEPVLRQVLAGERVTSAERRFGGGEGDCRGIFEAEGFPLRAESGEVVGAAAIVRDVTEERRIRDDMQETDARFRNLETELRAAVDARDEFLSVASHELASPLTALHLQVDLLQQVLRRTIPAQPELRPLVVRADSIGEQLERMGELVTTLLDTARLAAGEWKLAVELVDLGSLVDRVVRRLTPMAEKALCPLAFSNCESLVGKWDPERLEQVVTNILSNALKFGAGQPVEVTVLGDVSTARVRVRDRGIGLERDQQALIFERFGRAAPTRRYGGLGLGLWIAREAVQAMGGSIHVQSAPGEGATFEVVLPRDRSLSSPRS